MRGVAALQPMKVRSRRPQNSLADLEMLPS